MATFDDFVDKARSAAETVGKKGSDLIEVTRLKVDIAEQEKELSYTMEGLGRLLYDQRKNGTDVEQQMEEGVRRADELNVRINQLRDKICAVQHTVRCRACGGVSPRDAVYCQKCGSRLGD